MKEDKYWNFSKGERYATIFFIVATIATILYIHLPATDRSDDSITEQYEEEIKRFEEKLSKRETVKTSVSKKKKSKTTKTKVVEQTLAPKTRESGY